MTFDSMTFDSMTQAVSEDKMFEYYGNIHV